MCNILLDFSYLSKNFHNSTFLSNFLSTYLQFIKHFSDTLIPVLISWIPASKNFENDIDLDENQGPIERSSQFCDQCQTKELTNFAFDVR